MASEAQINRAASNVDASIGNDNFIVGAILVAFVVFITARGELPTYLSLFLYSAPSSGGASSSAAQTASSGGASSSAAQTASSGGSGVLGSIGSTLSTAGSAASGISSFLGGIGL